VTFHDGTPFTSAAVMPSIARMASINGGPAYLAAIVASVDTPDDLTAVAHLKSAQVPFVPGSLVINIRDMLERWTGGLLPATPHRVVNSANGAATGRSSVAYFQQPNPDALVAPALPVVAGRPDYSPVIAGEHISRKELGYHTVSAALDA
jgi:hypothetical protein